MKITRTELKQIIKEELEEAVSGLERDPDWKPMSAPLDIVFIPDSNFVDFEVLPRDGAFKLHIKTSYGYQELGGTLNASSIERAKEIRSAQERPAGGGLGGPGEGPRHPTSQEKEAALRHENNK